MCEMLEPRLAPATWPVPASHIIMNGFGAGTIGSFYGFHEGVDFYGDGQGGQAVKAVRGGTVILKDASTYGGMVEVQVDLPGSDTEYDSYLHVSDINLAPAEGLPIAEGADIGKITSSFGPWVPGMYHLHWMVTTLPFTRNLSGGIVAPAENSLRNPLLRFTAAADRDPEQVQPHTRDTNNDQTILVVTRQGDATDSFTNQTIDGDVDLIADVIDSMAPASSAAYDFSTNPYQVGYYISPGFLNSNGVKGDYFGSTSPYMLATFDDNWFQGTPGGGKTSAMFDSVYDRTRPTVDSIPFNNTNNMIITNTKGTDGGIANVDGGQYWNTNAQEDGADVTATMPTTRASQTR